MGAGGKVIGLLNNLDDMDLICDRSASGMQQAQQDLLQEPQACTSKQAAAHAKNAVAHLQNRHSRNFGRLWNESFFALAEFAYQGELLLNFSVMQAWRAHL